MCARKHDRDSQETWPGTLQDIGHHFPGFPKNHTVSSVSRDPSFRCGGRMVELNTSLESSWSTKLKFITFDLNRGIFDELEQVIGFEARSVNRFL